jgi:hypothetical protein
MAQGLQYPSAEFVIIEQDNKLVLSPFSGSLNRVPKKSVQDTRKRRTE